MMAAPRPGIWMMFSLAFTFFYLTKPFSYFVIQLTCLLCETLGFPLENQSPSFMSSYTLAAVWLLSFSYGFISNVNLTHSIRSMYTEIVSSSFFPSTLGSLHSSWHLIEFILRPINIYGIFTEPTLNEFCCHLVSYNTKATLSMIQIFCPLLWLNFSHCTCFYS